MVMPVLSRRSAASSLTFSFSATAFSRWLSASVRLVRLAAKTYEANSENLRVSGRGLPSLSALLTVPLSSTIYKLEFIELLATIIAGRV